MKKLIYSLLVVASVCVILSGCSGNIPWVDASSARFTCAVVNCTDLTHAHQHCSLNGCNVLNNHSHEDTYCTLKNCTEEGSHQHGGCGVGRCSERNTHSHNICGTRNCTQNGNHSHHSHKGGCR